jgi:cobalt-zinc-cadmium efflux system outer membrane protein
MGDIYKVSLTQTNGDVQAESVVSSGISVCNEKRNLVERPIGMCCKNVFLVMLAAVLMNGCSTYKPMPLTQQAVADGLTGPDIGDIRIKAKEIKHPLLKPIEFNNRDGLSPDEAAVLAVLANPNLRAIRDRRAIAEAQLLQSGILPNPQLDLSLDTPTGGNTTGAVNGYIAGLSWDITELLTHSTRISASEKNKASVAVDVAWQEWQIAEAAKVAVYDLFSVRNQLALAVESDKRLKENLSTVQKATQAGLMTALDISAAETASHQAHAAVLELQKQESEQQSILNQTLGLNADANMILQDDIELPVSMETPSCDKLLNELENRRLDLVALRFGYESQQDNLRAAVLNQFPRINIGVNNARDTGNVITTGLGITIDLPVFNRNQGQIAVESATRQQLFDEYVNRVFEARATIAKLVADMPVIMNQIKTTQSAVVSGEKLVETYRIAVSEGQADVLSYYNVWNELTNSRIEIVKLKQQLIDTRIALELATGLYDIDKAASQ